MGGYHFLDTMSMFGGLFGGKKKQEAAQEAVNDEPILFVPREIPPASRVTNMPPRDTLGSLVGLTELIETVAGNIGEGGQIFLERPADSVAAPGIRLLHGIGWAAVDRGLATAVFVLRAPDALQLQFGLAGIGGNSMLALQDQQSLTLSERCETVLNWLERHTGWLMILDSVNDAESAAALTTLLPRLQTGTLLVCGSHCPEGFEAERYVVPALSQEYALQLLHEQLEDVPTLGAVEGSFEQLIERLGGIPLAIEICAAYINHFQLSLSMFEREWEEAQKWHQAHLADKDTACPEQLAVMLHLAISSMQLSPKTILRFIGFFDAYPMPLAWLRGQTEMLAHGYDVLVKETGEAARYFDVEHALRELANTQLVRLDTNNLHINPLVLSYCRAAVAKPRQGVAALDAEAEQQVYQRWALGSLRLMLNLLEDTLDEEAKALLLDVLRPHAEQMLVLAAQMGASDKCLPLYEELASYYLKQGVVDRAEQLYRDQWSIQQEAFGNEHPGIAATVKSLALLLRDTSRSEQAVPLMQQVADFYGNTEGTNSLSRADCLHEMAELKVRIGRAEEAVNLQQEALRIEQLNRGPEDPAVASRLSELGMILLECGYVDQALKALNRALQIEERLHGTEALSTAGRMVDLADAYLAKNQHRDAENLLLRAVQVYASTNGRLHPVNARPLRLLTDSMIASGKAETALGQLNDLVGVLRKRHGDNHPEVSRELKRLAGLQIGFENWKTAQGLLDRCERIDENLYGVYSPLLLEVFDLQADLYLKNQFMDEARTYLRRAKGILEITPEEQVPEALMGRLREKFATAFGYARKIAPSEEA